MFISQLHSFCQYYFLGYKTGNENENESYAAESWQTTHAKNASVDFPR